MGILDLGQEEESNSTVNFAVSLENCVADLGNRGGHILSNVKILRMLYFRTRLDKTLDSYYFKSTRELRIAFIRNSL